MKNEYSFNMKDNTLYDIADDNYNITDKEKSIINEKLIIQNMSVLY